MLRYLAKRILYAMVVLLAVSLLTFFMSTLAPGDHVEAHLALDGGSTANRQQPYHVRIAEYKREAQRMGGYDPLFYFSIQPRCFPDTLHRIVRKDERSAFKSLLLRHGNRQKVQEYRQAVLACLASTQSAPDATEGAWTDQAAANAEFLLITSDTGRIAFLLTSMGQVVASDTSAIAGARDRINVRYAAMAADHATAWNLIPTVRWNGLQNQYHHWLRDLLQGDFGRSLIDGRPVNTKIREAIRWTLSINLIALFLAFAIAIPLGVITAGKAGRWMDKMVSSILFAFYAMPSFWLGMLCIVFLTTAEYGQWLNLFPTGGVGMVTPDMSLWDRIHLRSSHLALPVFCVLAGSLAFLTRQMRGSMLRELRQDYIRLARAKGLRESRVLWGHAARNAMFPMITMIGSAIPAAVSGSVILEVLFSIPGMGRLLYMSILSKDWPVVYAMVLLAATLTVTGYLFADILYRKADPRVEFLKTK